jgi:hypothetical protein
VIRVTVDDADEFHSMKLVRRVEREGQREGEKKGLKNFIFRLDKFEIGVYIVYIQYRQYEQMRLCESSILGEIDEKSKRLYPIRSDHDHFACLGPGFFSLRTRCY